MTLVPFRVPVSTELTGPLTARLPTRLVCGRYNPSASPLALAVRQDGGGFGFWGTDMQPDEENNVPQVFTTAEAARTVGVIVAVVVIGVLLAHLMACAPLNHGSRDYWAGVTAEVAKQGHGKANH